MKTPETVGAWTWHAINIYLEQVKKKRLMVKDLVTNIYNWKIVPKQMVNFHLSLFQEIIFFPNKLI